MPVPMWLISSATAGAHKPPISSSRWPCSSSEVSYTFVWDLGDVGIGLMTIFNLIALYPLAPKALDALRDYEQKNTK